MSDDLTFKEFSAINAARAARWHPNGGIFSWSITDWSNALAGEVGEACNVIKKLRRIQDGLQNISSDPDRQISDTAQALKQLGDELADTFIYLDLLATRCGLSLVGHVVSKFNAVSEKYDFPERLPAGAASVAVPPPPEFAHGKTAREQGGSSV